MIKNFKKHYWPEFLVEKCWKDITKLACLLHTPIYINIITEKYCYINTSTRFFKNFDGGDESGQKILNLQKNCALHSASTPTWLNSYIDQCKK